MKQKINNLMSFVDKKYKTVFIVILFFQLAFTLFLLISKGIFYAVDSASYIEPAIDFLKNGTMNNSTGPTLTRTPGYILFLSLIYLLTNYNDYVVVFIQIMMFLAINYMIFTIVLKLSKNKTLACLASLFYIFDIVNYKYAISIMTDIPFCFFVVLSLYLLVNYLENKKNNVLILSAASINIALSIRPQLMYLSILLIIVLLVFVILNKINISVLIVYVLVFSLIYFGWSYRNFVYFSKFTYTPIRDRDYFLWYAPTVYGHINNISFKEAQDIFNELLYKTYPNIDSLSIMDQIDLMATIGKEYVSNHFTEFIICNFLGLFSSMVGPNISTITSLGFGSVITTLIKYGCAGMLLLSYLIYAFRFLSKFKENKLIDWFILIVVMYFMASTAIVGYSRYRIAFYALSLIGTFTCGKRNIKLDN